MLEYPKIETLYNRDTKTFTVIPGQFRLPEFNAVRSWIITEKVDGTNIRIGLNENGSVEYGGRTAAAQIQATLIAYLTRTFTPASMQAAFPMREGETVYPQVVLYGEGYGEKVQKGGGNYRKGVSFRLFDVRVGNWWLEPDQIERVAATLNIQTVPILGEISYHALPCNEADLSAILGSSGMSYTAIQDGGTGLQAEGIVARSIPLLLTRRGDRVMWKLKYSDFRAGKR